MNKTCLDCGSRLNNGRCSNCQEELIINDDQMGEDPMPVSNDWKEKVKQQREIVKKRKNGNNQ